MTQRHRRPALAPPPIQVAVNCDHNPQEFLLKHYRHVWQTRMIDMPFVNAKLEVEVVGFLRHEGDWVGVIITPWFLNLFLLYGGGTLWADAPAGERRTVDFPCGALQFIADADPEIGPYQYCPLIASMTTLADAPTAHQVALDALQAVFTAPPKEQVQAETDMPVKAKAAADSVRPTTAQASRRGFLRQLTGKK